MAGKLACAIVGDGYLSLLAGSDGFFCKVGYGAAARREGLLDYQRLVASVGEDEIVLHLLRLLEVSKVVGILVKFDDRLSHSTDNEKHGNYSEYKQSFQHKSSC